MKKIFALLCLFAGFSLSAHADDIAFLNLLSQAQFKTLSEDMGAALSYKAVSPAEPLGVTGFDLGLEVTSTDMSKSSAILATATGTSSPIKNLVIPKLHAVKGLPFGIDIGAFVASAPTTNIKLVGGELKVALIKGGVAIPSVAIRGTMSKMTGVDQLDFDTRSLDLSISKGFLMLTPYAGVGQVWVTSKGKGTASALTEESLTLSKIFLGANLNFGLANLALEGDKTGDATSYSVKFGFRW